MTTRSQVIRSLAVAGLGVFAAGAVSVGVAQAAPDHTPSGEGSGYTEHIRSQCSDLWLHDHSVADEDRCRDKGWQITWRYNLSPDGARIWTGYSPCETEDSRRCYWNARTMGNGHGESFVQAGHAGTFYVERINGHRA